MKLIYTFLKELIDKIKGGQVSSKFPKIRQYTTFCNLNLLTGKFYPINIFTQFQQSVQGMESQKKYFS